MSQEEKFTEQLRTALAAEADVAWSRRAHPSPARFWFVLLGHGQWTPAEQAHVSTCDDCRATEADIRAAIRDSSSTPRAELDQMESDDSFDDVFALANVLSDEDKRSELFDVLAGTRSETAEYWTVAASSVEQKDDLYTAVRAAAAAGSTKFQIELDDGTSCVLFEILIDKQLVEPCLV
jgi:hypothetical protein